MNHPLLKLGNIPVTVSALESFYPHIKGGGFGRWVYYRSSAFGSRSRRSV